MAYFFFRILAFINKVFIRMKEVSWHKLIILLASRKDKTERISTNAFTEEFLSKYELVKHLKICVIEIFSVLLF